MGGKAESDKARKARLAAELRANLQRRKAQARARRAGAADARDEGIGAATVSKAPQDDNAAGEGDAADATSRRDAPR